MKVGSVSIMFTADALESSRSFHMKMVMITVVHMENNVITTK